MNKLPTKQSYLLLIIIIGIIALSVYSTYAIFTLESETSDIVQIHTPNSLEISTDMYEYRQITIPKNKTITTDVDIYNTYDYELCYSIWYKITGSSIDPNKVKVYQNTDANLTTSGIVSSLNSTRINLIITNDNDSDVKINIGLSSSKYEDSCNLNITKDKSQINIAVNNPEKLSDTIIKNIDKPKTNESGYLTYQNQQKIITIDKETLYISKEFTIKDEIFTLNNPKEITKENISEYLNNNINEYYVCIDSSSCKTLYKVNEIKKQTEKDETTEEIINEYYEFINYDKLVGYLSGTSGIKKMTNNNLTNYIYYGDNPDNFIYYNCLNELDPKTCELWRIIGIYYHPEENNYLTKIIRTDEISSIRYDEKTNTWSESEINKYLNEEYKLNSELFIEEVKQNPENIIDLKNNLNEIPTITVDTPSKINLLNITDYLNSSTCEKETIEEYNNEECLNNTWLNNGIKEWTMTTKYQEPTIDELTNETITPDNNTIYTIGTSIEESLITETNSLRPVIYLNGRIFLSSGDGTITNPYIIK